MYAATTAHSSGHTARKLWWTALTVRPLHDSAAKTHNQTIQRRLAGTSWGGKPPPLRTTAKKTMLAESADQPR